jgi:hypothetical protein
MHPSIVKRYLKSERLHEILNDDLDFLSLFRRRGAIYIRAGHLYITGGIGRWPCAVSISGCHGYESARLCECINPPKDSRTHWRPTVGERCKRRGGNSVISGDCSNSVDSTRIGSAKLPKRAVSDSWGAHMF